MQFDIANEKANPYLKVIKAPHVDLMSMIQSDPTFVCEEEDEPNQYSLNYNDHPNGEVGL